MSNTAKTTPSSQGLQRYSLRVRLLLLLLIPLMAVAALMGYWRLAVAQTTADELFDRALLSAALAISRDVVMSDGDALSVTTRDLINGAAGGQVFYHAAGPSGYYVTGFAYPPVSAAALEKVRTAPVYFNATYRSEPVRVLKVTERVSVDKIAGDSTVTVWQNLSDRSVFAAELARQAALLIGALLLTLVVVVWFGVHWGLRPLNDLQNAIATRTSDDLSTIKRAVPIETQGIVNTLNRLFGQVEGSMNAQQVFISDAAHQLRNHLAAIQSMAESAHNSQQSHLITERVSELVGASRDAVRVANQLLSLDRLQQQHLPSVLETLNLTELVESVCAEAGPNILSQGLEFNVSLPGDELWVTVDRVFIEEAIRNLLDNALQHGGSEITELAVNVSESDQYALITVSDNGRGLSPEDEPLAFERFSRLNETSGSGLGLTIASAVAKRHGGLLKINPTQVGASLTLTIPIHRY